MKTKYWMSISGFSAFSFFLVANFTNWFTEINLTAGFIQVTLNLFVFLTWLKGYRNIHGKFNFKKCFVLLGVTIPPVMATITITRVIVPAIF